MDHRVNVSIDMLARIKGAASDDTKRFYLNGVNIRKRGKLDGVVVEATSGHILAADYDDDGFVTGDAPGCHTNSNVISAAAIADIIRVAKSFDRLEWGRLRVDICNRIFKIQIKNEKTGDMVDRSTGQTFTDGTHGFIECAFPECERVIPRFADDVKPGVTGAFNARLLVDLAATAKTVKRNESLVCLMWQADEGSPAVVRVVGAPNWLGVIMPHRADVGGPCPVWFE